MVINYPLIAGASVKQICPFVSMTMWKEKKKEEKKPIGNFRPFALARVLHVYF